MAKNVIYDKSYSFALRVVKLSNYLKNEHKEFVLSRQILRSGTAIGALYSPPPIIFFKVIYFGAI